MKTLIEMKDIVKRYDRTILDNLCLHVNEGDYISICGESGCGKSTLMNILGLIESADNGSYVFCGETIKKGMDTAHMRLYKIGYIFQNYNLIEKLSVYDNITLPCLFSEMEVDKEYLTRLIQQLRIESLMNKKTSSLSGGEKQRVAIVRALIMNPLLILADEPTGNLDDENAEIVFSAFDKINQEGKTIIVITHDQHRAQYAKTSLFLKAGILTCQ